MESSIFIDNENENVLKIYMHCSIKHEVMSNDSRQTFNWSRVLGPKCPNGEHMPVHTYCKLGGPSKGNEGTQKGS